MVWGTTLTIRLPSEARIEQHINAAEARRALVKYVRARNLRINGNGHKGVLLHREGANSPVSGTYCIEAPPSISALAQGPADNVPALVMCRRCSVKPALHGFTACDECGKTFAP